MLKNIKAVIFDLDGTLVDSMWMWKDIDIAFLGKLGIPMPENLQESIEGMSFSETAVYFKERFRLTDSLEQIKKVWNEMAYEKYTKEVPMKKGAQDFLAYLKENQIKMGIATSNSRELATTIVRTHQVEHYFHAICTGCEVEKGKPAPDVYLRTSELIGIDPCECLVFEDITMGIMAGKSAGMRTCAVRDEYSMFQDNEKKELADYYINDYDDIFNKTYEVLKNE